LKRTLRRWLWRELPYVLIATGALALLVCFAFLAVELVQGILGWAVR
jgi:hypothetical protein